MSLSPEDRAALVQAMRRLERPSFAARLAALAGKPVALLGRSLPAGASEIVSRAATLALERALDVALFSLKDRRFVGGRIMHSVLASTSGAVGGALGLAALPLELPISTAIMLRAIAAIAQGEGEDLADRSTGLACLEVFALGAPAQAVSAGEAGYFGVRGLLPRALAEGADLLLGKGIVREGAPIVTRVLAPIVSRFGFVVSEKVAAQAVPVIGALGGAAVNLAFIQHFQELARGHFAVRRLERLYGPELVRAEYENLNTCTPSEA
ncbi:MAG: EcsC family protein [Alphaproteobacteria bacterium]|nr:EcsC family protein [Alphaproteobacteria bacterium]